MFEPKLNTNYLKLAHIIYGGELYLELKSCKLKEVLFENSKIKQCVDSLLSKNGNNNFYAYKNDKTGFVANLFENIKTKELIIAYRGTERIGLGENVSDINALLKDVITDMNLITGNFDMQFIDAWEFYKAVKKQNPKRKIIIVGQSLGGALAQIVSAKEYTINRIKVETYTYNAPGCSHLLDLYDCSSKLNYNFITNYSVMNDWCGMFGEHIGKRYLILPIEIPFSESNDTAEIINNILLETHEGIFNYTKISMGNIIRKPQDFNQKEGLSLWYFDKNNPLKDYPNFSEFVKQTVLQLNLPQIDFFQNSFMQKTENFLKENIPEEVQNSALSVAIKKAAENFSNNTLTVVIGIFDSVFSELSLKSLERAQKIIGKYIKN